MYHAAMYVLHLCVTGVSLQDLKVMQLPSVVVFVQHPGGGILCNVCVEFHLSTLSDSGNSSAKVLNPRACASTRCM